MRYFKLEAAPVCPERVEMLLDRGSRRGFMQMVEEYCESQLACTRQEQFMFLVTMDPENVVFGALARDEKAVESLRRNFCRVLPFRLENWDVQEITLRTMDQMLGAACRNGYLEDEDAVQDAFHIGGLVGRRSDLHIREQLLEPLTRERAEASARECLFGATLLPELDRIYTSGAPRAVGHPVHYLVHTADRDGGKQAVITLLGALHKVGRLPSSRCSFLNYQDQEPEQLQGLFYSCRESALVICPEVDAQTRAMPSLEPLSQLIRQYGDRVLTVICLPQAPRGEGPWDQVCFLELREDQLDGAAAKAYLTNLAKNCRLRPDKTLLSLCNTSSSFTPAQLEEQFTQWHQQKLRQQIYPQYRSVERAAVKEAAREDGCKALDALVGLEEAKAVIRRVISYYKLRKLMDRRGIRNQRLAMHMIFTGNPGTAKTTVARLFAQIMQEQGLLPRGGIHEVGRADLVGKYVGHTAPLVKAAFERAKGGVLFIDEAYSLVDHDNARFGAEAINTIVQEMENHRDDTAVIFAGYPEPMEEFLDTNPGLRSRINFHIPFSDYSAPELCSIARTMAADRGLLLAEDALEKLTGVFEAARSCSDFGNGRYVRNLVERAQMAQAERLMALPGNDLTDADLTTLCAADFSVPEAPKPEPRRTIGFAVRSA